MFGRNVRRARRTQNNLLSFCSRYVVLVPFVGAGESPVLMRQRQWWRHRVQLAENLRAIHWPGLSKLIAG